MASEARFLVAADGNRIAVVLDPETDHRFVEAEEELADIRAYDLAKAAPDEAIPFDQALHEIEVERAGRQG